MIKTIKKIISDDKGNMSSMRVLSALIIIVFLFNWTYACINTGKLISLSWEDFTFIVSVLGTKVWQKKIEKIGKE